MKQEKLNFKNATIDKKNQSITECTAVLETAHKNLMEYLSKSIDKPLYSPFAWTYILTLCKVDDALGHNEIKRLYSALGVPLNGCYPRLVGASGIDSVRGEYDEIRVKYK